MMNCTQYIKIGSKFAYHYYGIRIIQYLQILLAPVIPFFEIISWITRPAISLYFIFPLVFFIEPHYGLSMVWATVISEAINIMFKMLMQGDRPYWWAREHAGKYCRINIKQYPSTCEVSPGTPSGHVFIATAVIFTLLYMCNCYPETCTKKITKFISFLILLMISISRVVIGSHFPHQVLLGLFLGIMVAKTLIFLEIYKNSPLFYFRVAVILFIMGLITKNILPSMGFCNCWSVIKAKRYCQSADWVPTCVSRPFVSYLKLSSILIGTGLSMLIIAALRNCKVHLQKLIWLRIVSVFISLAITSTIYFKMSKYSTVGPPGYSFIILKNMMIPLTVIVFVPMSLGTYHG